MLILLRLHNLIIYVETAKLPELPIFATYRSLSQCFSLFFLLSTPILAMLTTLPKLFFLPKGVILSSIAYFTHLAVYRVVDQTHPELISINVLPKPLASPLLFYTSLSNTVFLLAHLCIINTVRII